MSSEIPITGEMQEVVYEAFAKGSYIREVAKALSVSERWFYRNQSSFKQSIKKGREFFVNSTLKDVETSLLNKCLGIHYTEKEIIITKNASGDKTGTKERITKKYLPPSDTAIIFTLVNKADYKSINNVITLDNTDNVKKYDAIIEILKENG